MTMPYTVSDYCARKCEICKRWIDCDSAEPNDYKHVDAFHPEVVTKLTETTNTFPFMNWNEKPVLAYKWDDPL